MKITEEKIIELLKSEVESRIDYDTLQTDLPLSDQGMDSLDSLTLFLAIEEEYGVKIEESEMDKLRSIDNIIEFVNNRI